MRTLTLVLCFAFSVLACTQAQLDKANSKIDQVTSAVECRAKILKPYEKMFTTDQVADALVGKMDVAETLAALEVVASDVAAVREAFKLCSE